MEKKLILNSIHQAKSPILAGPSQLLTVHRLARSCGGVSIWMLFQKNAAEKEIEKRKKEISNLTTQ